MLWNTLKSLFIETDRVFTWTSGYCIMMSDFPQSKSSSGKVTFGQKNKYECWNIHCIQPNVTAFDVLTLLKQNKKS